MVERERSAVVVRGHRPLNVPQEAIPYGLTSIIAVVLSTNRSDNPDMVIDHELWLACMQAVRQVAAATESKVFLEPQRRFLEQFRQRQRGPAAGSVEDYAVRIRGDRSVDDWETILWRDKTTIVAAATCERWYVAGGPMPYHDSFTTSIFVKDFAQETTGRGSPASYRPSRRDD